jgi:hypothetical protein
MAQVPMGAFDAADYGHSHGYKKYQQHKELKQTVSAIRTDTENLFDEIHWVLSVKIEAN